MNINDILKNQELTDKLIQGQISDLNEFCVVGGFTDADAMEISQKLNKICISENIDPTHLDEDALDKVSGGFGLSKNHKSRAVIAGLMAITSVGGVSKTTNLKAANASAVVYKSNAAGGNFNAISTELNKINKVMDYTSFHIYSSQERADSKRSLESLLDLSKRVVSEYGEYANSGRGQLAAQNLETAILNANSVLNESFKLDRNAVYNYGVAFILSRN